MFFVRSLKNTPFFPQMRSIRQKPAIFELGKKSGFESCSDISFPLGVYYFDAVFSFILIRSESSI